MFLISQSFFPVADEKCLLMTGVLNPMYIPPAQRPASHDFVVAGTPAAASAQTAQAISLACLLDYS